MTGIDLAVLIPVYNDWASLSLLLPRLDELLAERDVHATLIIVNDASSQGAGDFTSAATGFRAIRQIDIVELNCNLGHQRAIAVGLVEISKRNIFDAVVVMDADGEDRPEDVMKLIAHYLEDQEKRLVVAWRARRSEGTLFRACYAVYKWLFRLLTGQTPGFGNFCLVPSGMLNRLIYRDSIWTHLAATILRSKLPYLRVATERGRRLQGNAKMNFEDLALFGFSAISVYADKALMRIMLASMLLASALAVVTWIAPGRASGAAVLMLGTLVIAAVLSSLMLIQHLAARSRMGVPPPQHAHAYIHGIQTVFKL
jgi:hypothetical protein